jgi:predicted small lipoprotein YifL
MRKPLFLMIATLLLAALSGCGQKGPLVLPEPEPAPAQERR